MADFDLMEQYQADLRRLTDKCAALEAQVQELRETIQGINAERGEQAQEIELLERERNLERQRESDGRARQDAKWADTVKALRAQNDRLKGAVREQYSGRARAEWITKHATAIEEAKEVGDAT